MSHRTRMLPLWLWLTLALGALAGLPVVCNWGVSQAMAAWQQHAVQTQVASVRRIVGADVNQWRNPVWQRQARTALTALSVDVVLVDRQGVAYATSDALLSRQSPAVKQKFRLDRLPTMSQTFTTIAIGPPRPARAATTNSPYGMAYLWFGQPLAGLPPPWIGPIAGLLALMLTLALVALLLARLVLRPLAAMSQAARQIAGGEWDIHLPPSEAREVAEVSAALAGMSAALQEFLKRQSALEEERRLFVGAIAHDLRTPLFALRGYLKGLESGVAQSPERIAHYVHASNLRAAALEDMIAQLFSYARVEYLEQEPRRESLELGAILREAVDEIQSVASSRGIDVVLGSAPAPCPLVGDPVLLSRAVRNLLDNAVQHTPIGGCVAVRWGREGDRLMFRVDDTGPGIDADVLPHLFTPLYRGEPSRNRQTGGAGLGLTIARRILRAHGGDLAAANGEAGGAVFTGTLPLEHGVPPPRTSVVAGSSRV